MLFSCFGFMQITQMRRDLIICWCRTYKMIYFSHFTYSLPSCTKQVTTHQISSFQCACLFGFSSPSFQSGYPTSTLSETPAAQWDTAARWTQREGFSHSYPPVTAWMLFDVPSQRLSEEQYWRWTQLTSETKWACPLSALTGAVHGSKAANSEAHRELRVRLWVGSISWGGNICC